MILLNVLTLVLYVLVGACCVVIVFVAGYFIATMLYNNSAAFRNWVNNVRKNKEK